MTWSKVWESGFRDLGLGITVEFRVWGLEILAGIISLVARWQNPSDTLDFEGYVVHHQL